MTLNICVGRKDLQPVSASVVTMTATLPFTAAGCNTLHSAGDNTDCTAASELLSSASKTLVQNSTAHSASIKHVLTTLPRLVSSRLSNNNNNNNNNNG